MDSVLRNAIDASLGALLETLRLQPTGQDTFGAAAGRGQFPGRIYGGQLLAQAIVAAGSTVDGKAPSALHAMFVEAGDPALDVELAVDRVRDGRSLATRQVTLRQANRLLLTAVVSFATNAEGPDVSAPMPAEMPTATLST